MLDIRFVRENPDTIRENLKRRKDDEKLEWVDDLLKKDEEYRSLNNELQKLRHERNEINQNINKAKKSGADASELIKRAKELPSRIKSIESDMESLKEKIRYYLMRLPNIMHESVPYGADDSENVEIRKWGEPKRPEFELKPHGEIAEQLGIADFKRSAKIAGAGFYYLKGELAMMDVALQKFALDTLTKKGWTVVYPPVMMNRTAYEGVTDLKDFEDVMYKIEGEDLYLIATSEHPMGAMYMDETLNESQLPIKFAGVSPCFRKEIGSRGVDTKGIFRVHQFNKIEQFVFCTPDQSWEIHEEMVKNAEDIFKALKLPYRVVNICTGDLGIVAAKKYDIEVWYPRQNKYGEVVSCSNCTAYQAVRLNIRYRIKDSEEKAWVHTLNSTAIATSRALVAILENYQNKDGTVTVPEVLVPYMNGVRIIGKNH